MLSVGGNDALAHSEVLGRRATNTSDGLLTMAHAVARFDAAYRSALAAVLDAGLPAVVCTVYDGRFDPSEQPVISAAVRMFDDAIFQAAFDHGLPVIDLRRVCREPEDYANAIEPSARGGLKIARAILHSLESGAPVWPVGERAEGASGRSRPERER